MLKLNWNWTFAKCPKSDPSEPTQPRLYTTEHYTTVWWKFQRLWKWFVHTRIQLKTVTRCDAACLDTDSSRFQSIRDRERILLLAMWRKCLNSLVSARRAAAVQPVLLQRLLHQSSVVGAPPPPYSVAGSRPPKILITGNSRAPRAKPATINNAQG